MPLGERMGEFSLGPKLLVLIVLLGLVSLLLLSILRGGGTQASDMIQNIMEESAQKVSNLVSGLSLGDSGGSSGEFGGNGTGSEGSEGSGG
jgi:hypothetical protein